MTTTKIPTKKELESKGWVFLTTGGGAIAASNKVNGTMTFINAPSLTKCRKEIAKCVLEAKN